MVCQVSGAWIISHVRPMHIILGGTVAKGAAVNMLGLAEGWPCSYGDMMGETVGRLGDESQRDQ